jgi:hypothetical protein
VNAEAHCLTSHDYDTRRIDGFNATNPAKKALDKESSSRESLGHDLLG